MWNKIYNMVKNIVFNITKNNDPDLEDLIQEVCLILLEMDQEKLKNLYNNNELNFYITRIVMNNIKSKTSQYYYKYKKHHNYEINFENLISIDERNKNIEKD